MRLTIPKILQDLIAKLDDITGPIDEIGLASKLESALGDSKTLSPEERRGAFAAIAGFWFQRPHRMERRTWGIYWAELSSWITPAGKQNYSPDVADVDEDVLLYWIKRSASAKHPALRARFADLSWEIGRFLKKKSSKADDTTSEQPISIDIPVSLAHRAIDGYLEAVELGITEDEYQAWQFLDRAIELSVTINDPTRIAKAKAQLFAFHRKTEEVGGNPMWWFDDITWERTKALDLSPSENQVIIASLERALARHSDSSNREAFDPHSAMDAADRLTRRRAQTNEPDEGKRALKTAGAAFEEA